MTEKLAQAVKQLCIIKFSLANYEMRYVKVERFFEGKVELMQRVK